VAAPCACRNRCSSVTERGHAMAAVVAAARRSVVRLATVLAVVVGGMHAAAQHDSAHHGAAPRDADGSSPTRVFHLYATDGYHRTADGATLYIWGYSLEDVPGTATLPAPTIEVNEGDRVEIVLTNIGPSRPGVQRAAHTIHLHGLDVDQVNDGVPETGPSARVGESVTYRFTATHAGTYWYHCHVETVEHLTMGMYGALVVHPADGPGRAWTDGPSYDRAYTLLLSESDPAWSAAVGESRRVERTRFDPRYFFINGRSFPDTMAASDTHVMGHLGDRVLVRLINAGYGWRSMHMHGFHFEVVASDGRPLPAPLLKDTIGIAPGERYDLLVTLDQLGSYPFHSHVLLDNMNDGVYPGGIHTMVTVVPAGEPLDLPDHVGHGAHGSERAHDAATASAGLEAVEAVVRMAYDRFVPDVLTVPVGTTVTWVKDDGLGRVHAVYAPSFKSPDLRAFETWQHTFDEVGVFEYECPHHSAMIGYIRVVEPGASAP
jgi:manganese oxidase